MLQLKRRKAPRSGLRDIPQIRCAGHLKWVRGHECACINAPAPFHCVSRIEAAHVRTGTDGGTGVKPGDNWAIPLCQFHHNHQHQIGERPFETKYNINMKAVAAELWAKSPHRKYAEAARQHIDANAEWGRLEREISDRPRSVPSSPDDTSNADETRGPHDPQAQ